MLALFIVLNTNTEWGISMITRKLRAEYKEKIKEFYVEEINDHAFDEYFAGYILFDYETIKTVYKSTQDKIKRDVKHYLLETKSDLPFKNGDIIRLDGKNEYTIEEVEIITDERFKTLIFTNQELKTRYTKKVLRLYDYK